MWLQRYPALQDRCRHRLVIPYKCKPIIAATGYRLHGIRPVEADQDLLPAITGFTGVDRIGNDTRGQFFDKPDIRGDLRSGSHPETRVILPHFYQCLHIAQYFGVSCLQFPIDLVDTVGRFKGVLDSFFAPQKLSTGMQEGNAL